MEKDEWIITDPDHNQKRKDLGDKVYLFKEDRLVNPETKELETYELEIDLKKYTEDQMWDAVSGFGYSRKQMQTWISASVNLELIAECIFETS
ncbi:MAG TPA: hypothetical protein VKN14_10115 [Flavobacteriaceae bacterium]|nr:hypothetical protein [Flavobacteriaceae bacterium]